jgi:DNA glycosylase AlkZ-like
VGQRPARVRRPDACAPRGVPQDGDRVERRRRADVLVDGLVAGMWSVEKGRVVLEPLARFSRSVRREVEDEAERLEAFVVA